MKLRKTPLSEGQQQQKKMKKKKGEQVEGAGPKANGGQSVVDSPLLSSGRRSARRLSTESVETTPNRRVGIIVAKSTPPGNTIGKMLSTSVVRSKIQEKRHMVLMSAEKEKKEREEREEREEDTEMKENESAPVRGSVISTPKSKKPAAKDSVSTPTETTSNSNKKKKKKKKQQQQAPEMRIKSQVDSNGNGVAKTAEEEAKSGDDELPVMKEVEPSRKEIDGERKRVKVERRLQKKSPRAVIIERNPSSEPTVSKRSHDTVQTKPVHPTVALSKNGTVPVPHSKNGLVATTWAGTTHPEPPHTPTVFHSMGNGWKGLDVSRATPKHIRFVSESPEKPQPTPTVSKSSPTVSKSSPTVSRPIDIGEESTKEEGRGTKMNGRMKKDSSPDVSTTSSEDEEQKKEQCRKKKLTKKPEVTSSTRTVAVSPSKTTSSREATSTPVKMTSSKSPLVKAKPAVASPVQVAETQREKSKKKKSRKETIETEPEEETVRPSHDLLQMVAARLANSHGLLAFRLISSETRRIAEQHLRKADSVLHLEEFDDENAFTRDDMTQWWEAQREAEDTSVGEGKENRSHAQISAYLLVRSVEKQLVRDMDGGVSHPSDAATAVDPLQLLQHPLETLDAACLLHESQAAAVARLLQQEGHNLKEVWLGHCSAKLVRELKTLTAIERFEHRQATMETLEKLPLLQMTELRLDIVDEETTRSALADHLVNGQNLRVLELNVVPCGPLDGNTASQYTLFTRRTYDRADYTDDLEWMIPNVEDGEPDPVTLCVPSLEHLATNVANVKLFWQLRDSTLLLRHLLSLRIGTLSKTKELITSSELFADTKESRRYRQPGFFALRDAYETQLESVTLRLGDRVGVARLQREAATLFEAIGELPPSLRRLSTSLFFNQFAGVCAPFRKWAEPEAAADAPDTDHIGIEELHLHFERAFDLRGLPVLLPRAIKTLSIAINYENDDDARCLLPFIDMLQGLERLECLEDLHIQVWGVRCLQPLVAAVAGCSSLAARLTRLAVAAYPVDDGFFEGTVASSWLRSSLSAFPNVCSFGLHAAVLVRMIPEQRRTGYSWRNGLAWLANESLVGEDEQEMKTLAEVELSAAPALPVLDDGEDYTITPHWEVEYDAEALVLSPEDEQEPEEIDDPSFSIPHGSSDEDDDFITDGEDEEEQAGDASRDDLDRMEEGLEDETERIERRERKREEKEREAIERGEVKVGDEEEEGEVIDFDSISDQEEEEAQPRSEFFDDEAEECDGEESGDEEEEKQEESAESDCSSEDDDERRDEEEREEEGRRQKRRDRKQAKLDAEVNRRKRKRVLESDEEEDEEEIVIRRASTNKRKKIIESDEEE